MGLLFSISGNSLGEMFPLYMGRNIVGRDATCDVCLPEETVSGKHAVIVVRNIPQPQPRLIVSIKDTDSSCGTYINDESIDFDVHLLEDKDRLRIGVAYELLFFKFDPNTMGLSASPHFKAIKGQAATQAVSVDRGHNTRISSVQTQQPAQQQIQQARQQMKEQTMQQLQAVMKQRRYNRKFLQMLHDHRASGKEYYETIFWSSMILNSALAIMPTKNQINNMGLTADSTHFTGSIHTTPRAYRRIFTMKRHEMQFPLRHPRHVIEHVAFKERLYRVHAWEHPWIKVSRSLEELLLNLRYGNFSIIGKALKNRLRILTGRRHFK